MDGTFFSSFFNGKTRLPSLLQLFPGLSRAPSFRPNGEPAVEEKDTCPLGKTGGTDVERVRAILYKQLFQVGFSELRKGGGFVSENFYKYNNEIIENFSVLA